MVFLIQQSELRQMCTAKMNPLELHTQFIAAKQPPQNSEA